MSTFLFSTPLPLHTLLLLIPVFCKTCYPKPMLLLTIPPPLLTIIGAHIIVQPILFLLSISSLLFQPTNPTTPHHSSSLSYSSSSVSCSTIISQAVMTSSFIRSNSMCSHNNPFISRLGCTLSNVPRLGSLYLNPRHSWSVITWFWKDSPSTIGYGTVTTPSPSGVAINRFRMPNIIPCLSLGYIFTPP